MPRLIARFFGFPQLEVDGSVVKVERRKTLAIRWLITNARKRGGRTMTDKLANELLDAAQNQGTSVKKREDTHRMAEANKAFAHYRW